MGLLVDGRWQDRWYSTPRTRRQVRAGASRSCATGSRATARRPEGRTRGFKAEPGRYHLYVSLACPWAHRTLIFRALKKLEDVISVSVVHHFMGENGWTFLAEDGATGDTLYGLDFLHQIYTKADQHYSGRVTVPVLWDKTRADHRLQRILRDHPHAEFGLRRMGRRCRSTSTPSAARRDRPRSTRWSTRRSTTASTAPASPPRRQPMRRRSTNCSRRSTRWRTGCRQRYLAGDRITEADWRLFTTLVRFDPVYFGHFKCNLRRIADYPNLSNYLRDLYQVPGVAGTVNLHHIKAHYYGSHETINPTRIVPIGPESDYAAPHDRGRFSKAA